MIMHAVYIYMYSQTCMHLYMCTYTHTYICMYWHTDLLALKTAGVQTIMFRHDCLDTCCFEYLIYACALYFCICTWLAQLSMFHMERHSRNMPIIIIISICISSSSSSSSSIHTDINTYVLTYMHIYLHEFLGHPSICTHAYMWIKICMSPNMHNKWCAHVYNYSH